jgi:hypothetical protein
MAVKVTVRAQKTPDKKDIKGHTYIHFGGDLKTRFLVLAQKCGFTRAANEFGVLLFEQALTDAEKDYDQTHKK